MAILQSFMNIPCVLITLCNCDIFFYLKNLYLIPESAMMNRRNGTSEQF